MSLPLRWVPSLYLIEGLPNAVVVTLAVIMLKDMGIDNAKVAMYTSLLYLPWAIKPFWAPFVDIMLTKRIWTVMMQFALCAGMAGVAIALPTPAFFSFSLAAFWGIAFCSATHDIAADGYYLLALDRNQQAFYVGIRSTFYRLANLMTSGGIVFAAGVLINRGIAVSTAWSLMFVVLSAMLLAAAIYHSFALPRPSADKPDKENSAGKILRGFAQTFTTFVAKKHFISALAFMLLYRLPEALLGKMVQPFLKDPLSVGGLGLSTEQIGIAYGTFGVTGIVLGGIIGGMCVSRYGLKRMLWPMALSLTLPSAFYWYLAVAQPSQMWLISSGIFVEQFGYGFGFTAYMMYLMYFSEGSEYSTSHYAFCTGIMALGLMLPGLMAGHLELAVGYVNFFMTVMICCIPTFAVCALVKIKN